MGKLVESTFVSLDGVISDPQKWSARYWDDDYMAYASKLLFEADALVLGRVTYENFAQAWPGRDAGEFGEHINSMPKYVASRTLTDATWNATIIEGDPAEAVARLKEEPGANLLKYGTGELDKALMAAGLVDEFHLWRIPVVVGAGDRIFDGFDQTHLKLVDTTSFGSGIAVQVFAPS